MRNVDRNDGFASLLERARSGESAALEELTARYYADVQRMVSDRLWRDLAGSRAWLASRFSTGDVVQEVFFDVVRDLDGFRGNTADAFRGYLSIVVRNRILDVVRHHVALRRDVRRSVRTGVEPVLRTDRMGPLERAASEEEITRVREHLDAFEPRVRHLLRARLEGLATFGELAEQLGYETESGARRAYYVARAKLALALGGQG